MYKTTLVKGLIAEGESLVRALEKRRFPLAAAFWYYPRERMTWRLYVVTSAVERQGTANVYKRIQDALAGIHAESLLLDDISVISPSSSQFNELRLEFSGMTRLPRHSMPIPEKDVLTEDAYICRWPRNGHFAS